MGRMEYMMPACYHQTHSLSLTAWDWYLIWEWRQSWWEAPTLNASLSLGAGLELYLLTGLYHSRGLSRRRLCLLPALHANSLWLRKAHFRVPCGRRTLYRLVPGRSQEALTWGSLYLGRQRMEALWGRGVVLYIYIYI